MPFQISSFLMDSYSPWSRGQGICRLLAMVRRHPRLAYDYWPWLGGTLGWRTVVSGQEREVEAEQLFFKTLPFLLQRADPLLLNKFCYVPFQKRKKQQLKIKRGRLGRWQLRSTCCSSRVARFGSQRPRGASRPSVTSVPRELMLSSGLCRY